MHAVAYMRTCAVCLQMCICLRITFEALVELSQTDEVWEGHVTCVLCSNLPQWMANSSICYSVYFIYVMFAGANQDDRLQKAYAEYTRMCRQHKIRV